MEIEYPRGIQVTSNNSMKYTYHSSSNPQQYQQYSQPYDQNMNNQSYRFNQPNYQYNNSYANVNNNNSGGYQGGNYIPHNSGNSSGYPFTQYHQMNNNCFLLYYCRMIVFKFGEFRMKTVHDIKMLSIQLLH